MQNGVTAVTRKTEARFLQWATAEWGAPDWVSQFQTKSYEWSKDITKKSPTRHHTKQFLFKPTHHYNNPIKSTVAWMRACLSSLQNLLTSMTKQFEVQRRKFTDNFSTKNLPVYYIRFGVRLGYIYIYIYVYCFCGQYRTDTRAKFCA